METTPIADDRFPIRLRADRTLRVTGLIGGVLIAAAGMLSVWGGFEIGPVARNGWILIALGSPFAIYGLVLAPGSQWLEVILEVDQVTVRGFLGTRRIPRAA